MSTLLGMKTNGLAFTCLWLLLGAVTIQLPAQGVLKFKPDEVKIVGGEKDSTTQFKPSAALNEAFQEEWRTKREEEWRKEFEALKTKAEGADSNAKWQLGIRYYQGRGVTKNLPEALRLFREAAEHGVNGARYNLGLCYANGEGVTKDSSVAQNWFSKYIDEVKANAARGDAIAQEELGSCYAQGRVVAKDLAEAVNWYRKAAEQGNALAQFHLGNCLTKGDGVPKDLDEAVRWYQKSADQGGLGGELAEGNLRGHYNSGEGVNDQSDEAQKWRRKWKREDDERQRAYANQARIAANDGDAKAQNDLGFRYENEIGVTKDFEEAVKWYRKSAEQGYAPGQYSLGRCYEDGVGVIQNRVEAHKWFNLASVRGDEYAKKSLLRIEQWMPTQQIAEAQRLAREFKPRKVPEPSATDSPNGVLASRPSSTGTGFFITEDGYLITNEHVAGSGAQVRLVTSAGIIAARVVKVDAANDLALLKAEGRFAALPVVASRAMRLGSTVATVGFPNVGLQGFAPKLARGDIAALSGAQDDARYFQISVPVQPGNSGGALVDERGNVVGVVSAKLSARAALAATGALPENVNYAVKSSFLLSFLESVPDVSAKLKDANTKERKFEDVVKSAEQAAVLVLVY